MKTYKDFNKRFIGISDYAKLIMVGCTDEGVTAKTLSFHGDNSYSAYIVTEPATIGEHYEKVAEFRSWLKIYDDRGLTAEFNGQKINVYRAGDYGCIIEIADIIVRYLPIDEHWNTVFTTVAPYCLTREEAENLLNEWHGIYGEDDRMEFDELWREASANEIAEYGIGE